MAIALVANVASATNSGGTTSGAIDTTGANLLVAVVSDYKATAAPAFTDSKGNTWTGLTAQQNSSQLSRGRIYYAVNPVVGSGHTFTYAATSIFASIYVAAFSGADTASPFDQENGAQNDGAASLATGSVTPSEANELVVAGFGATDGGPFGINGGFTITDQLAYSGGNYFGGALAYLIQTSAAAANPTWTPAANAPMVAVIATFKASAGGGVVVPVMVHHGKQQKAA